MSALLPRFYALYFWRQGLVPIPDLQSQVYWEGPSHDTDSKAVSNSVSTPVNAFSQQQNAWLKDPDTGRLYWMQNVVQVINGRVMWTLANFDVKALPPPAPGQYNMPQEWTTRWADDGQPYDMTSGNYVLLFVTRDTGTQILQQLVVVTLQGGGIVWRSALRPSQFYGKILVASLPTCGFGGGSRAVFTAGKFYKKHSVGAGDLMFGGSTIDYSRLDQIPLPFPMDTAESSNMAATVPDSPTQNVELQLEETTYP